MYVLAVLAALAAISCVSCSTPPEPCEIIHTVLTPTVLYDACKSVLPLGNSSSCMVHLVDVFVDRHERITAIPWISPLRNQWSFESLAKCSNAYPMRGAGLSYNSLQFVFKTFNHTTSQVPCEINHSELSPAELHDVCKSVLPLDNTSRCVVQLEGVFGARHDRITVIPWVSPLRSRWSLECLAKCSNIPMHGAGLDYNSLPFIYKTFNRPRIIHPRNNRPAKPPSVMTIVHGGDCLKNGAR